MARAEPCHGSRPVLCFSQGGNPAGHDMTMVRLIGGILSVVVLYGAALFLPAGTLHWPRAWVLIALTAASTSLSTAYLSATSPEIVKERWRGPYQAGQPLLDRVLVSLFIVLYLATFVFTALDVFRWHLLRPPGVAVSGIGLVMYVASWALITRVLRENAFASAAVRYQEERHQRVIDTGPYAVVRHPMYAASIPLVLGLPLWLGSWAAAIAGVVVILCLTTRIPLEEGFLLRNLAGYAEYRRRVRWRLIPGVW